MRRPAPALQLSPRVIRQFALITLIATALLAMFSSGENAELTQAIKDREARNELARTEARKLGADKVGTVFRHVKHEESGEGFEKLNGYQEGGSSGSSASPAGWAGPAQADGAIRPAFLRDAAPQPFAMPGPSAPKGVKVRQRKPVVFTGRERDALKEAARQQSGLSSTPDLD